MASKYSYVISNRAENDIDDIFEYIKAGLSNDKAARDLFNDFISAIDNICSFPHSSAKSLYPMHKELYKCIVNNYIIFYTVTEESRQVNIVRVLYAKRDLHSIL